MRDPKHQIQSGPTANQQGALHRPWGIIRGRHVPEIVKNQVPSIVTTIRQSTKALTVSQLSDLLSVGRRTLYDAIDSGRLPAYRFGSNVRLDPQTTADWLQDKWSKAA